MKLTFEWIVLLKYLEEFKAFKKITDKSYSDCI